MTKNLRNLCLYSVTAFIAISLLSGIGAAAQTVPLPDIAAPSYHPGLFTKAPPELALIPPLVNTFEGAENGFSHIPPSVSYSFFPGNTGTEELPSVAGYVSGPIPNAVTIYGRANQTEQFQYLATISTDNRGIFVWPVPELSPELTEFSVEIAQ